MGLSCGGVFAAWVDPFCKLAVLLRRSVIPQALRECGTPGYEARSSSAARNAGLGGGLPSPICSEVRGAAAAAGEPSGPLGERDLSPFVQRPVSPPLAITHIYEHNFRSSQPVHAACNPLLPPPQPSPPPVAPPSAARMLWLWAPAAALVAAAASRLSVLQIPLNAWRQSCGMAGPLRPPPAAQPAAWGTAACRDGRSRARGGRRTLRGLQGHCTHVFLRPQAPAAHHPHVACTPPYAAPLAYPPWRRWTPPTCGSAGRCCPAACRRRRTPSWPQCLLCAERKTTPVCECAGQGLLPWWRMMRRVCRSSEALGCMVVPSPGGWWAACCTGPLGLAGWTRQLGCAC